MDFIDRIRELATRIPKQLEYIQTEEATKNALIMPFISALGYNVFDPTEVTPELNADIGIKKGEKVDYAILRDGKPIMLFECKHHAADLSKVHASQLYRYFSVTEARFGVLTNGIVYWFYTDLDAPNKMDAKPFFEFSMLDLRDQAVEELKKFSKSVFDLSNILTTANELKYSREIKRIFAEQLAEPSDEFVKFFVAPIYTGKMTQKVREQFAALTRLALRQYISDQVNERLKTALAVESAPPAPAPTELVVLTNSATPTPSEPEHGGIQTTAEELEAFYIIRAILREVVPVKRVVMRDVQSYCGILLDDNNRKPICRLYFNSIVKSIGFFDGEKEARIPLLQMDELYGHAGRLKATVVRYDAAKAPQKAT
ncbi:type I restriction endonuclease [Kouleothrix sp.]|uniref:type I restriction endonuclease n=1 Tax=Kouleothrix sp. TaxID=2779161 RepID=UPI00391BDB85